MVVCYVVKGITVASEAYDRVAVVVLSSAVFRTTVRLNGTQVLHVAAERINRVALRSVNTPL